jgi:hypothetical protein
MTDSAADVTHWSARSILDSRVAATLAVYRVSGSAVVEGVPTPFEIALKVLADGSREGDTELAAYRAFALRPPTGLAAPRRYCETPLGAQATGLWLEFVDDQAGRDWPPEAFARTAFACGVFAGAQLSGERGGGYPDRVKNFRSQQDTRSEALRVIGSERDHPILSAAYPDGSSRASGASGSDGKSTWPPWTPCPSPSATAIFSGGTWSRGAGVMSGKPSPSIGSMPVGRTSAWTRRC